MFTIDASVWVNADSPAEVGQPLSRSFLDIVFARGLPIVVPNFLAVEVAGVIRRTRGDADLAKEFANKLLALPQIRWIEIDRVIADKAIDLAAAHSLRGADAIYAAVAAVHHCKLISLDHEQLSRLHPALRVMTPAIAMDNLS